MNRTPPPPPPPAAPPPKANIPTTPPYQDATPSPSSATAKAPCDVAQLEKTLVEALAGVAFLAAGAELLKGGFANSCCGCIPAPAAAPQGGLSVGSAEAKNQGFPANAVRTAGGYTIVPEGKDAAWKIYGPGQQYGDDALTRVWGDPHVNEKDGTRWDFTKDSNFQLPDGTIIRADTTSETGHSLTQGLTIINGNDRVSVGGVNTGRPSVTATKDADAWMDANAATLQSGHTFTLQTDGKTQNWFRSTNGQLEGIVTGSRDNVDGKGSYDQVIDPRSAAPQAQAQTANVDMEKALGLFGLMALGGLGFLGAARIGSFLSRIETALSSLTQQAGLDDLYTMNRARAGVRV